MLPIGNVLADETNSLGTYYYRVTNVDQSDVLNLRDEPTANSDIVGSLAWNERLVTITKFSNDGKWGLLPSDGDDWVSMKYLEPIDLEFFPKTRIPVGLTCFGWDPTWTVTFSLPFASVTNGIAREEKKAASYAYDIGQNENSFQFYVSTRTDDFTFEVTEKMCETTASSKFPYSVNSWDRVTNEPINRINGQPLYGGECCTISKLHAVLK